MASPRQTAVLVLMSSMISGPLFTGEPAASAPQAPTRPSAAREVIEALPDPTLRQLAVDVLTRNPELAAAEARARAAALQAPQAGSLADPVAAVTAFLLSPETRVGPQQAAVTVSQTLPWFGKLRLREQAAVLAAAASQADAEALGLQLVTEARRLWYELALIGVSERIVREDRETLIHFEQLTRARYAAGVGLLQGAVTIQAEITRADSRLLDLATRSASLTAAVNSLRDRPQGTPLPDAVLPAPDALPRLDPLCPPDPGSAHPELLRADADVARAATLSELASASSKPDLQVGLTYALVGRRTDPAGRLDPPRDNGQDILGLTGSLNLPLWRARLEAAVEQAAAQQVAAEASRRATVARLHRRVAELTARLALGRDQLRLFEDLLIIQAEQSLLSAEAAYSAGTLDAVALLDAERTLLEVRLGFQRALTDCASTAAELEQALGAPLTRGGSS